jgi:predicted ATPase
MGILEKLPGLACNCHYCFAHDQIELAAHALLDEDAIPCLKLQIGKILFKHKENFDYQGILFTIVDMWDQGKGLITAAEDIELLIHLNFTAGKKALASFAFEASSMYLRQAIDLIPEDQQWGKKSQLSVELYSSLIKAEFSIGTMWEQLDLDIEKIVAQKNLPILDKIVAYSTKITMLAYQQHNHTGAITLAVDVLGQLGCTFNPHLGMLAVIAALIKTKLLLRKTELQSLLDGVKMEDKNKMMALQIIAAMNSSMYASSPELLLCTVLKTLRWSLKFGVSKQTPICIGFYAVLEMAMGSTKSATSACKISLKLAEKLCLMHTEYAPTASAYGFVLPWTTPLQDCANHLLGGYNNGIQAGDLEYAFMNITLYCFFRFSLGKTLSELERSMRDFAFQMKEYDQFLQLQFLSLTWQTVLNLMGWCEDPLVLTGEAMEQEAMLKAAADDKNPPLCAQLHCHRLQLAVYYCDFDLAGQLIGLARNIGAVNPANPIIWRTALFEGVAAFELVRRRKRQWKRTALQAIAKVRKWVDEGNLNCVHILYLLQAEKAAMEKNTEIARTLFDKAIVTAARNGYRNDRALASERCAAMYTALGDDFWAKDYLEKAREAYEELEAYGKLQRMTNCK